MNWSNPRIEAPMPEEAVTEIRPHEHVLLIAVLKRSLDETSAHQLTDEVLTAAAARPHVPIVLDMSHVRFAPSTALGSLVKLNRGFRLDGRKLALIGIDPRVLGAIKVTCLDAVLEIHNTLEQAIGATPKKK
jgi:anti-anti-sigma factor